MAEQNVFYRLTEQAFVKIKEQAIDNSPLAIEYVKLNPNNEPFEVTKIDKNGNVISVLFGTTGNQQSLSAEIGTFFDYWCLWLSDDSSLERIGYKITKSDKIEEKPEEWFVLSGKPGGTPSIHGPLTKEKAYDYAVSQRKNAIDEVRVRVLKVMDEAFLKVEFN